MVQVQNLGRKRWKRGHNPRLMSAPAAANTLLWIIIIIVAVVLLIVILDRFVLMTAPLSEGVIMPKLFYLLQF